MAAVRARSLCIASGKGGTGKSVVTASLAHLLAARGRALIADCDLGVGNAHILQNVSPETSFVDVVEGRASVREIVQPCSAELDLIGGGCGVSRMAQLTAYELHLVASGLADVEREYRYLLVDSAAGVSRQTVIFAAVSDLVLLVTTPDLTAMTDAYAFLKVLLGRAPETRVLLCVNRARDAGEAESVAHRIQRVAGRFLGRAPELVGWLPDDPAVTRCVNHRAAVVALEPTAPFARLLRVLSARVLEELSRLHPRGLGATLLGEVGLARRD
jgi:flagellar biosynthesis protein FlhG